MMAEDKLNEEKPAEAPAKSKGIALNLSWRTVSVLLLIVIAVMLAIWRPWQGSNAASRTISVTGEATVSAEPDELVFYPNFTLESTDDLAKRANELTEGLKALGVEEKAIKTNANAYEKYYDTMRGPDIVPPSGGGNITLQLTITLSNKDLAQKVQDYLVAQEASGQITPQGSFSDAKRKELQNQASDQAAADARAKAEKMVANLGGKLGKVVKVGEAQGYGIFPMAAEGRDMAVSSDASLPINLGENDFSYTLQVEYELK